MPSDECNRLKNRMGMLPAHPFKIDRSGLIISGNVDDYDAPTEHWADK